MIEAGYVLSDGRMLDFSGKKDGGPAGDRAEDHRQLNIPTEENISGTDLMNAFMRETGAIRMDNNTGLFDINTEPSSDQYSFIKEVAL